MGRTLIWVALGFVALVFVGWFVLSVLGTLLKIALYLLVGTLVVGAGLYLVGRARGGLTRRR